LSGDADRNQGVNSLDFSALATHFNQAGATFSQGNFNYDPDGNVDFNDLVLLAQRYNTVLPSALVAAGSVAPSASVTASPARGKKKEEKAESRTLFSIKPVAKPPAVRAKTAARRVR
jgi:hypothetical protein